MHAGCVYVAVIHLSRTWMSGSFESMWWNACVHRLDHGLYPHLGFREWNQNPSTGGSEEGRTRDASSHRTVSLTHYRLNYSGPFWFYDHVEVDVLQSTTTTTTTTTTKEKRSDDALLCIRFRTRSHHYCCSYYHHRTIHHVEVVFIQAT